MTEIATVALLKERIAELEAALRQAQNVLATITGGDISLSAQHLWAQSVEAETKARAALAGAR